MPSTVFITGASGYVGRHVAAEFIRQGHAVLGLVRSDKAAQALSTLGGFAIRGDLEHPETYEVAVAAADIVVHAGFAYTGQGEERADVDQTAVAALLRAAGGDGEPRIFIYTASAFRYLSGHDENATELDAIPRDPAEWRHAIAEQVLAASTPSLKTAVIRLGWIYGSDGGTLGQAIAPLAGTAIASEIARNRVPLFNVFELARLYVRVAQGEGGLFHGCDGRPATVGELAKIATALNADLQPSSQGAEDHFASIFQRDTPIGSIHQPVVEDMEARVAAALKAGRETRL